MSGTGRRTCTVEGCTKPRDRQGLCQMHAWRLRIHGDVEHRRPARAACEHPGCARPRKGHGLCELHLSRRNAGIPADYQRPTAKSQRYRIVVRPGHPLASARGRVYEHRAVFYGMIGEARVPCFWCGAPLTWSSGLTVDHLNHRRRDNQPTNLVPACNGCNAGRTVATSGVRVSVYS